jgi:hypothetical protein
MAPTEAVLLDGKHCHQFLCDGFGHYQHRGVCWHFGPSSMRGRRLRVTKKHPKTGETEYQRCKQCCARLGVPLGAGAPYNEHGLGQRHRDA